MFSPSQAEVAGTQWDETISEVACQLSKAFSQNSIFLWIYCPKNILVMKEIMNINSSAISNKF